jgi:hypothetical protein
MENSFPSTGEKSSSLTLPPRRSTQERPAKAIAAFLVGAAAGSLIADVLVSTNSELERAKPVVCRTNNVIEDQVQGCKGRIVSGLITEAPDFAPLWIAHRSWGVVPSSENERHSSRELWGRWRIEDDHKSGVYVHTEPIASLIERGVEPRVGDRVQIVECEHPTIVVSADAN